MKCAAFAAVLALLALTTLAHADPLPTKIDASVLGAQTFNEQFKNFSACPSLTAKSLPACTWRTVTGYGAPTGAGYRQNNAETYFGDATTAINPFKTGGYGLAVTAQRTKGLPFSKTWNGGMLSTKFTFAQLHGYFEFNANLPACVKGVWPALWLMPTSGAWPQHGEIDFPETVGHAYNAWTIHDPSLPGKAAQLRTPATCARGFHTYGVLWRADQIGFYLDRVLVGSQPTPADYTVPMFLIMQLQVGGAWPGEPDPSLNQVQMFVLRVGAWALK